MSRARTRFLWITDPWDTLDHANDTTLRVASEARLLGASCHWCDVRSIRWERGEVRLDVRELGAQGTPPSFDLGPQQVAGPTDFTWLHYRTDPPVDLAYIHPLQLLCLDPGARKRIVNPASALLLGNEKLEGGLLPDLLPPTVISSHRDTLREFGESEKRTVLKPLHEAQSKGVKLLSWDSGPGLSESLRHIEGATVSFTQPVLLQRFLPGIAEGEVRLWFLDSKLLACVRKLPLNGDFRVDIDRGSGLAPHELSRAERAIARRISGTLRERKIRLAAVDLIDGLITDYNFTSPGLIPRMERLLGRNLARPIAKALMSRP